jgi:hypothetical protein
MISDSDQKSRWYINTHFHAKCDNIGIFYRAQISCILTNLKGQLRLNALNSFKKAKEKRVIFQRNKKLSRKYA